MVLGSTKTYGELMLEARAMTSASEIGEIQPDIERRFKEIIQDAVQANHDNGVRGKYYIHIILRKEPYANNALHIYPQCRRTRPSPYQNEDHFLWSVDGAKVTPEWNIPSQEVTGYILAHPNKFDPSYVTMLRSYCSDKLEKMEDYLVNDKVI